MSIRKAIASITLSVCILLSGCGDSADKRDAHAKAAAEKIAAEVRVTAESKVLAEKKADEQQVTAEPKAAAEPATAEKKAGEHITLKDDLRSLDGEWRTIEKSPTKIECAFDPGSDVFRPMGRVKLTVGSKEDWHGSGILDLKEIDGKRYIVFDPLVEKISGLPRQWRYKLDGDSLTLSAENGKYKGEYKLERIKKK